MEELLRYVNHRGSEVRVNLFTGSNSADLHPYPAFIWQWKTTWNQEQHIDILEFTSFLNYLRALVLKQDTRSLRLFHIFDSKVCCGVLGKGRSASKRLNRVARRLTPILLGMDWYVMCVWTLSRWQYADKASRILDYDEEK